MLFLLGGCLLAEGASTGLWIAGLLQTLAAYDGLTLAIIAARVVVGALQLVVGAWLWRRAPQGTAFGPAVFLGSAALLTLELGARLSPSRVYPNWRWHVVGAYWLYAAVGAAILAWTHRRRSL